MPAAMHTLRDKARLLLQTLLRDYFDKVDDALFELADKASNNVDQNVYFESMREVRVRRRNMEIAFFRKIDIGFAQLLDANAYRNETHKEESVSIDDLSLVKMDELEEVVATENMVNKANELYAESMQHLTLRIDHLVPIKVYQKNNPLGVDAICNAFIDSAHGMTVDVKAKLVLYKLFDNMVMSNLGKFYEALNQTLIDVNILPSLKTAQNKKAGGSSANGQGSGQFSGSQDYDEKTNQVLQSLRELLSARRGNEPPVERGEQELETGDLIKMLSFAQHQNMQAEQSSQTSQPANLRAMLNDLLRNEVNRSASINQVDDDVINLVSMMFEFILDDRNLAAPMKALIARLQIPMVKVAIADKSFFSKGGHPARRLLNEMAMASLGWQETSKENLRKDNLYTKMESMVNTVISDFETDMDIFETLLVDFRSFIEKDKRRAQILEQRTLDAEDGKAKSERARAQVDVELNRICARRELPAPADKLLREAWANVMFITALKHGAESDEWKEKTLIAQQLVWSVCVEMDKDNRQKLLRLLPVLLQKLRTGLENISFSPFETTQLFKSLEVIHLGRLRGDAPAKTDAPATPAPSAEALTAKAQELAEKNASLRTPAMVLTSPKPVQVPATPANDAAVNSTAPAAQPVASVSAAAKPAPVAEAPVVEPQKPDPQHLALINNLTQGTWFEMQGESGEKYRCRLAAIIRPVGKYIFVNRSGMKVAEESRESLAIAMQNKRLTILDDGMLFDRALESVISNLRNQRMLS